MKQKFTEWEKIFVNYTSEKGCASRIYKELAKLNLKKQTIQLENGQNTLTNISLKKIYRG